MRRWIFYIICIVTFIPKYGYSTHLRAADIVAERIDSLTYRITLTVYTDYENVPDTNIAPPSQGISVDNLPVSISDGWSGNVSRTSVKFIGNGTFENKYVFDHTFPGAFNYFIRFTGVNRNSGIVNIGNPSDEQQLYVETFISISGLDPNLNRTPFLLVPPIDLANVGQVYTHNPGAYDLDGDSISFKLLVPKKGPGTVVTGYKSPNDISFGSGSTFSINSITGDIVWDTPLQAGEYNIAFMIEEWRGGIKIGYVVRDMQIIVEESNNIRPELIIPSDTCAIANSLFIDTIFAFDPNGDDISLEYFGGMFISPTDSAFVVENQILNDSIVGYFNWTPSCDFIQEQPHHGIFKVEDAPVVDAKLSTLLTWAITIIGPKPEGLIANNESSGLRLVWDPYSCGTSNDIIKIWRRKCDTLNVVRNSCDVGVLSEWGFEEVGNVNGDDTTFFDDNLNQGSNYYYMISVEFGAPKNGKSLASDIVSAGVGLNLPIISEIDVDSTGVTGAINLSWLAPIDFDTILNPGPYTYNIYRITGHHDQKLGGALISSISNSVLTDTFFYDNGLNTQDTNYSYFIELISGGDTLGSSNVATTEWLISTPKYEGVQLEWSSEVPWTKPDSLYQIIYMEDNGVFEKVDSVQGGINSVEIDDLVNCQNYCFYVETRGVYCHDSLKMDLLVNRSQVRCEIPVDTVPPCAPVLEIEEVNCDQFNESTPIENSLSWNNVNEPGCDTEPILSYNIYLKDELETYNKILNVSDTIDKTIRFDSLLSMAECYVITSIDKSNNESEFSNEVCGDNCPKFELPNVFTPNNSGINDFFVPIPTPMFIENVSFEVYNRWGELVFKNETKMNIEWDGKSTQGNELTEGIYYYRAIVTFDVLNPDDAVKEIKGWVLLLR